MKITMNYLIDEMPQQQTVDQYLKSNGYSASLIKHLRHTEDGITLNGEPVYTSHRLELGESLCITLSEEPDPTRIVPTPMDLDIRYEDRDIFVINKGAGVPIHPSQGNFDNTLANGIAYYLMQKGESGVYRAINRLDRDTTGLLILAKHPLSACILSDMVRTHAIHRQYLAITCGRTPACGIIDAPIARANGSTIERCVDYEHGEEARTRYRRLSYDPVRDLSLVAIRLETGRTHQIRVHFKSIGHPLPGDFLYHPDYRYIGRQALHSFRLDFLHPIKKGPLHFEAPLADDMLFPGFTSTEDLWDNDF